MGLRCLAIFAVLVAGSPLHAAEERREADFSVNFSLGNIGIGAIVPFDGGGAGLEGSIAFLALGAEHNATKIGLWISPVHFFARPHWDGEDEVLASFLNLTFYWNALSFSGLHFGPFASVNYLFLGDTVHWERYVLTAGLQMGMRWEPRNFNMPLFSTEAGFRLVNGRGAFFASVKIDLVVILLAALLNEND